MLTMKELVEDIVRREYGMAKKEFMHKYIIIHEDLGIMYEFSNSGCKFIEPDSAPQLPAIMFHSREHACHITALLIGKNEIGKIRICEITI